MRYLLDVLLGRLFLGKLLFRLLHLFGDRGLAGLSLAEVGDVGFKYRHLHLLLSAPPQSPP